MVYPWHGASIFFFDDWFSGMFVSTFQPVGSFNFLPAWLAAKAWSLCQNSRSRDPLKDRAMFFLRGKNMQSIRRMIFLWNIHSKSSGLSHSAKVIILAPTVVHADSGARNSAGCSLFQTSYWIWENTLMSPLFVVFKVPWDVLCLFFSLPWFWVFEVFCGFKQIVLLGVQLVC